MEKLKSFRLLILLFSLLFMGLNNTSLAKNHISYEIDHYSREQPSTPFNLEESEPLPQDRYEIALKNSGHYVLTQEYSGPGLSGTTLYSNPQISQDICGIQANPSFYHTDQRKLIFQFLYPFHFFF